MFLHISYISINLLELIYRSLKLQHTEQENQIM